MNKILIALVSVAAIGIAFFMTSNGANRHAALVPSTGMRELVKGKTANDIAKIVFAGPLANGKIVVTDKSHIAGLLDGLREAVYPREPIAISGPSMTIYWADGKKFYDYGFANTEGPDYAYGEKFARAFNRVASPGDRVNMKRR